MRINSTSLLLSSIVFLMLYSCTSTFDIRNSFIEKTLFKGIQNNIKLNGNSKFYLESKADSNKIYFNTKCSCYPLIPNQTGNKKYYLMKGKTVKDSVEFAVINLPTPQLTVAGSTQSDATIKKADLIKVNKIEVQGIFNLDGYEIVYFKLLAVGKGTIAEFRSESAFFTEEMINEISNKIKGSRLTLTSIKVKMPDGEIRKADPFDLKIL